MIRQSWKQRDETFHRDRPNIWFTFPVQLVSITVCIYTCEPNNAYKISQVLFYIVKSYLSHLVICESYLLTGLLLF
jgi:hypothetical protein